MLDQSGRSNGRNERDKDGRCQIFLTVRDNSDTAVSNGTRDVESSHGRDAEEVIAPGFQT